MTPDNPLHIWILAARPKTLYAAIAPVLVGTAVAARDDTFRLGPALAALLAAVLIQIGTNFANDVADFQRGADTRARLGPVRVTQAGLISPARLTTGMWVVFGSAAVIGLYLVSIAGWPVLIIGLLSIIAGIAYTAGPAPLGYHGLGDLAVFIFFGLVAVIGTYYVQALTVSLVAIWAAIPMGFLSTAILAVNNLRDIETDRTAGKRTLAVRLGARYTIVEIHALLIGSYLIPLLALASARLALWVLLPWLSIPLAYRLAQGVSTQSGRELNRSLAAAGQLELVYGILLAIGLFIA